MSMRETINSNPSAMTVGAVVLLVGAIAALLWWSGSGSAAGEEYDYYYDPVADETFVASGMKVPPIESPWGHMAVRVHYYSCGDCTKEDRFLGYYEKYSPRVKQYITTEHDTSKPPPFPTVSLVSNTAEENSWVSSRSPRASAIMSAQCPGDQPITDIVRCEPEDVQK